MKKIISLTAAVCTAVSAATVCCAEEKTAPENTYFWINLNDCLLSCEQEYYKIDDELYLPLRAFAEKLDMSVSWNDKDRAISINSNDSSGLFPFEDEESHLYGYKNINGDIIIPPTYKDAGEFNDGLARVGVKVGGVTVFGYIDETGNMAIPAVYKFASDFNDGIASVTVGDPYVTDADDEHMYIDTAGNTVFDKSFLLAYNFTEDYAVVLKSGPAFPVPTEWGWEREWSYINKDGEYATELTFEEAIPFENGISAVCKDGKWSAIDHNFQYISDNRYDSYQELMDSLRQYSKYESNSDIEINGVKTELNKKMYTINDRTYISMDDIERLFNNNGSLTISWNNRTVYLSGV